jgi:hypothetical protein
MWRRSIRDVRVPVCRLSPAGFLRVAVDQGTGLSGLFAAFDWKRENPFRTPGKM